MKLPWQKADTPVQTVKGRAAVVPKSYKFQVLRNATSNNFTVDSYSTVVTTVKVLKEGETAENTAAWLPGTINVGAERCSVEEVEAQGMYRVQFDAPNWVGVIISQDGSEYVAHVELPVWIDPATGRVVDVDVPELIRQLEPKREQLSRIWGVEEGPFADFHQALQLPKNILKTGKYLASIPGELFAGVMDLVSDLKKEAQPHQPLPPEEMPDLTQYEPVEGIDFNGFVHISFLPEYAEQFGTTYPEFCLNVDKKWRDRMREDPKLMAFFQNELQRLNKDYIARRKR